MNKLHEVYSSEGFKSKTDDWKIYHRAHHTSSIDLGILAKELNPKTLVPSHILFWGASEKSIRIDFSDAPQNKICDGTKVFGLSSLAKMPKSIDEV